MKKPITLFLSIAMALSLMGMSAAAAGKQEKSGAEDSETEASDTNEKKQAEPQKQFRVELNEQKKELQKQVSELNQQKEELEAQYETLLRSGDTAGAEALLTQIQALDEQIQGVKTQIKKTINERWMVVKTMYTDEELAQFDSAADLITQMYADAKTLAAGCVTVNNNLIKFEAPPYIKGGVTLIPVRAVAEKLGAEVSWDADTQKVTITKNETVIEITVNKMAVLVNGVPTEITLPAEVTCGKTYLPLRFLAEVLGFDVTWDGENEVIDISDTTTGESTADATAADTVTTAD